MSPVFDRSARFISSLEALVNKEDRAALAALRRGLGKQPGATSDAHRYVVPWLPREATVRQEDAYYLIASLFAWHQRNWPGHPDDRFATNLGASFSRLKNARESDSVEKRFVALLDCHPDDLANHLRHAVSLLRASEIPVDWAQLLEDVQHWGWESRTVQRSWARAYWGRAQTDEGPEKADDEAMAGSR